MRHNKLVRITGAVVALCMLLAAMQSVAFAASSLPASTLVVNAAWASKAADSSVLLPTGQTAKIGTTAFATVQDAVKKAGDGYTIYIYPGSYALTADATWTAQGQPGWYLPIVQNNLTLQGVTVAGAPIRTKPTATSSLPVLYGAGFTANGSWASQDLVAVFGDNVTLQGLEFMNKMSPNKTLELSGANPIVRYCRFSPNTKAAGVNHVLESDGKYYDYTKDGGCIYVNGGLVGSGPSKAVVSYNYFLYSEVVFDSTDYAGSNVVSYNTFDKAPTSIDPDTGENYCYYLIGNTSWETPTAVNSCDVVITGNRFINLPTDQADFLAIKNRMNGKFILSANYIQGNDTSLVGITKLGTNAGTGKGSIVLNSYIDDAGTTRAVGLTIKSDGFSASKSVLYVDDSWASQKSGMLVPVAAGRAAVIGANAFAKLETAVKKAVDGTTVYVFPGEYGLKPDNSWMAGGQGGWYLPILQNNFTLQGVNASGVPILSKPSATTALPLIYGAAYTANGVWSTQSLVAIFGNNVTIQGLSFMPKAEPNKTIEMLGANPVIRYNRFQPLTAAKYSGIADIDGYDYSTYGGSLYVNGGDVASSNVRIEYNYFIRSNVTFDSANYAGSSKVRYNTFDGVSQITENATGTLYNYSCVGTTTWASPAVLNFTDILVERNVFKNYASVSGYSPIKNNLSGKMILRANTMDSNAVLGMAVKSGAAGTLSLESFVYGGKLFTPSAVITASGITAPHSVLYVKSNWGTVYLTKFVAYNSKTLVLGVNAFTSLDAAKAARHLGDVIIQLP